MDKKLLERYLSDAESHVDTARMRVTRQATVLRLMKREGMDVAGALELMTQFEGLLATLEGIRDFILRQLGRELTSAAAGED
jgi:hypothetical protein